MLILLNSLPKMKLNDNYACVEKKKVRFNLAFKSCTRCKGKECSAVGKRFSGRERRSTRGTLVAVA